MPQGGTPYHHGDLRAACVRVAREMLEEDGSASLSLRAVARRAGVSATAPYRHFSVREELVSAVAAEGYRELAEQVAAARPAPETPQDLIDLAIAYVRFALDRPALFRVMFAEPCDPANEERAAATAALSAYLRDIVATVFPETDTDPLATAMWALVHGLAFLHLDGKLDASSPEAVAEQVRSAINATLIVTPTAGLRSGVSTP